MVDYKEISEALLGENTHRIVPLALLFVAFVVLIYKSLADKNSKHYPHGKRKDGIGCFPSIYLTSHRTTSSALSGQFASGSIFAGLSAVSDCQHLLSPDSD